MQNPDDWWTYFDDFIEQQLAKPDEPETDQPVVHADIGYGVAAYMADQWEKRQHPNRWEDCPSTHCERSGECRSPHECCANVCGRKA